jgi:hypothetical protein
MNTCKWRVVWRGLTLPIVFCFLIMSVYAQEHAQQTGPPIKARAFKGLPNLLASNTMSPSMNGDENGEQARKRIATEKEPVEKDPTAKKEAAPSSAPSAPIGAEDPPLGHAGPKSVKVKNPKVTEEQESGDFAPVDDRWRIGFPDWDRHGDFLGRSKADYPYVKGRLINPYRQNFLKGDYPILGNDKFFTLTIISETFLSTRRIPLPSDVSAQRPDSREFFGRTGVFLLNQNFEFTGDFYQGDASFKPVDWRVHATVIFNINYFHSRENGVVNIDDKRKNDRRDGITALQEAFAEYRLGDTTKVFPFLRGKGSKGGYNPFFDTTSFRAGIQHFNSDFRGFIYNDTNLGARLFGNFKSNRYQFNLAYFDQLEKDTNSGLNTLNNRNQKVVIANLYRQDTFKKGYTVEFSYHYNRDEGRFHNDENGFPVRPEIFGFAAPHDIHAHYIGFTTDGHFGEKLPSFLGKIGGGLNLTTAFYQVLGEDTFNGLAGRKVDINAQLAAAELSVDRDWLRFRTSFLYASGDNNPTDGTARGFDHILDNNNFAGGQFSFLNAVGFPFTNTTTSLFNPGSLIPDLRSSKIEGQANFVNPGIYLVNLGMDADITQKLRLIANVNYARFATTESLKLGDFQPTISKSIGTDFSVGMKYRPKLNDNIVIFSGISVFKTGAGYTSIYQSNCNPDGPLQCGKETGNKTLFNLFTTIKLTY